MTLPAISAAIVGTEVGPVTQAIDARWLMAYAAGLGESDPRYYDTPAPAGPAAHPMFPVCYEWPVALLSRSACIDAALAPLGVHATHDAVVHRSPRAGDVLRTSARIVDVVQRRSGTLVTTRFTTVDEQGVPVTTTDYGSLYRGVSLVADSPAASPPGAATTVVRDSSNSPSPSATEHERWRDAVAVGEQAARVYTECARIWNPIHTDVAVARAAGLPAPILHGTATLALALSRVIARDLNGDPEHVRRVSVRFTGMVFLPSAFVVRGLGRDADAIVFDAVDETDRPVLSHGRIVVGG